MCLLVGWHQWEEREICCFGVLLQLELYLEEIEAEGQTWQVGLVASISCITGRTWSFFGGF